MDNLIIPAYYSFCYSVKYQNHMACFKEHNLTLFLDNKNKKKNTVSLQYTSLKNNFHFAFEGHNILFLGLR